MKTKGVILYAIKLLTSKGMRVQYEQNVIVLTDATLPNIKLFSNINLM